MTDETHSVPVASQVKSDSNSWSKVKNSKTRRRHRKQKSLTFALYIKKKSKILVRSYPGYVRVDRLQLLIYFCD